MYLRRRCRHKGGETYESWALVETVRTARGPRQRTIVTVGKLPGMDEQEKIGWEEIGRVLDGKPAQTPSLFEQESDAPTWATVNLKGVQVERLRHFGDVYLGLALWKRLGLEGFCGQHTKEAVSKAPFRQHIEHLAPERKHRLWLGFAAGVGDAP